MGASGFLVGVRSTAFSDGAYAYAVTNRHVIRKCGPTPIIRMNNPAASGGFTLIETHNDAWVLHNQGDDLAVHPVTGPGLLYSGNWVPEEMLLTEDQVNEYDIGPGDEVFFVGRFVNHEGRQKNWPALRFGNISMMPWEPIRQEEAGIEQESFVVEGRSMGGYSGAPVFIHHALPWAPKGTPALYVSFGSSAGFVSHGSGEPSRFWLATADPNTGVVTFGEPPPDVRRAPDWRPESIGKKGVYTPIWLLGVDWGHLEIMAPVVNPQGEETAEGGRVFTNSGMTCVVPAWKLRELLDQRELVEARERGEGQLRPVADQAAALDATRPDRSN